MLWIQGTNPAGSMPDVGRVRGILAKDDLFVVASDAFLTETAGFADLVLPTALWGEKTGCTTNVSHIVHITHKAVEPRGEARSDLDIFPDFADRMDFHDGNGGKLLEWTDAEGAFNGWRDCTRGRPCDYRCLSERSDCAGRRHAGFWTLNETRLCRRGARGRGACAWRDNVPRFAERRAKLGSA